MATPAADRVCVGSVIADDADLWSRFRSCPQVEASLPVRSTRRDDHCTQRERRGRAYAYWPTLSEAELAAQRMRAALDRTADREKTLAQFVDALSVKDERALRRILGSLTSE